MQFVRAEKTFRSSIATVKTMLKTWRLLMKTKERVSRRKQTGRRQSTAADKDHSFSSESFKSQTNIPRINLESSCGTTSQNNPNSCVRLEERLVHRKLSLPCGRVEEQLVYTRCVEVSSGEDRYEAWFDLYQEEQSQETRFDSLNDHSETRLVDGLLTTTLCSTEL